MNRGYIYKNWIIDTNRAKIHPLQLVFVFPIQISILIGLANLMITFLKSLRSSLCSLLMLDKVLSNFASYIKVNAITSSNQLIEQPGDITKKILIKGYSFPRDFSWIENYKLSTPMFCKSKSIIRKTIFPSILCQNNKRNLI